MGSAFDAIVLAGGNARRLDGADKPGLVVAGESLLDRVLDAVRDAERRIVVGPVRPVQGRVHWCREHPPGAGPVAAVAAGLRHAAADTVLVLAADLPWIAPAIPQLMAALDHSSADAAVVVDRAGFANHLAAAWRRVSLTAALERVGQHAGASMRSLATGLSVLSVMDQDEWSADCDTWQDVARARERAEHDRF